MAGMIKEKKGVFFTFIGLFVIILIIAVITTRDTYRYREKSNVISSRIRTMNTFIDDFEKDLDRELFIGGYRALISMNSYVRVIEDYVSDFDSVFNEILMNGTANNTAMDLMVQDSQGADIRSWLARINDETSQLDIIVSLTNNKLAVEHTSPWNVRINYNTTVIIQDAKNLAMWNFTKKYSKEISILGFEDPLYIVGTADKVTNLVNITPDFDFVDDATNDTTALNNHLLTSYYINTTGAPSFLMRFSGNFSPSPYGIESMVNLEEIDAQAIPIKARSVIDYIYFYEQITTDYCNVTGVPSWFRIDDSHIGTYEIDKLEYSVCS